jgi:hypothetical protein
MLDHIPEEFHDYVPKCEACVFPLLFGNKGFRDLIREGLDLLEAVDPLRAEALSNVDLRKSGNRLQVSPPLHLLKQLASTLSNRVGFLSGDCVSNGRTNPRARKNQ